MGSGAGSVGRRDDLLPAGRARAATPSSGPGVGRALVGAVLDRYRSVRQKVLLTDDEPAQRALYESLGYAEIRDHDEGTLRAFVRIDLAGTSTPLRPTTNGDTKRCQP